VAAVDGKDATADFSSRGPRHGDLALKPDISAPGVDIVAAKAANGRIGEPSDNPAYVGLNGTSMAAPHVTGAAAVLAGEHPDWTGQQLKAALMSSAKPTSTIFEQGAGRLDIGKAVSQTLVATPPSVSVPTQLWPHTDDAPVTRELTYHNYGKTPLTLTLSADVRGPTGQPAPGGMFGVSPKTVTVPAGEDGSVTVTTNTKVAAQDGQYAGRVVAAAADLSIATPIAVNREVRSYNLTVTSYDRQGGPAAATSGGVFGYDGAGTFQELIDNDLDGTVTVRLPYGKYMVGQVIADPSGQTEIDAPLVDLSRDTRLVFDARKAKAAQIGVDKPAARLFQANYTSFVAMPDDTLGWIGVNLGRDSQLFTASVGAAAPPKHYLSVLDATLAEPGPGDDFADSPYAYRVATVTPDRLPTGIQLRSRTSGLARVDHRVANLASDQPVTRMALAGVTLGSHSILIVPYDDLRSSHPGTVTQYLTPDALQWSMFDSVGFGIGDHGKPGPLTTHIRRMATFQARTYQEQSDGSVLGAGFQPAGPGSLLLNLQGPQWIYAEPLRASGADPNYTGRDYVGTNRTALYRDGKPVADGTLGVFYNTPAAVADYRLEASTTSGLGALSTTVSGEWNFRTKANPARYGEPLPLFALRFAVADGKAKAGKFDIPVVANRQIESDTVTADAVEFSVDDGKTWQAAAVRPNGTGWIATVDNPASGLVSLRGNARDDHGNTAKVTIIRAYQIA
jgi:hypothetical protein